jgi:hypothetical protein
MKVIYEDEISQTPEVVFPWIADPSKAMKWQKNVKSEEIIKSNPEIIGTTFKEVIEEDGKTLEMYGTIIQYERDKIIGFNIESKIHNFEVSYVLEAIGKKTKLSIETNIQWKFPMNVICILMHKKIVERLKKQLELEVKDLQNLCTCSED